MIFREGRVIFLINLKNITRKSTALLYGHYERDNNKQHLNKSQVLTY